MPFICDGVTLTKEHVAEVRAAVVAQRLESRALCTAQHVAFFAGPEACSDVSEADERADHHSKEAVGGGGGGTCGVGVPTRVRKLGGSRIKGVLARTARKVTRFGEQLAVLSFSGSLSAALPQHAEFLGI